MPLTRSLADSKSDLLNNEKRSGQRHIESVVETAPWWFALSRTTRLRSGPRSLARAWFVGPDRFSASSSHGFLHDSSDPPVLAADLLRRRGVAIRLVGSNREEPTSIAPPSESQGSSQARTRTEALIVDRCDHLPRRSDPTTPDTPWPSLERLPTTVPPSSPALALQACLSRISTVWKQW